MIAPLARPRAWWVLALVGVALAAVWAPTSGSIEGRSDLPFPRRVLVNHGRFEPHPDDVFAVPISGDPIEGPSDALVTIVHVYDYVCPYCERVRRTLDQLMQDYRGELRIVYNPVVYHPQVASLPAAAACAAHEQGRFLEMDALLSATFSASSAVWRRSGSGMWTVPSMVSLATELGLDLSRFELSMHGDCESKTLLNRQELERFGFLLPPAFFINGRYLRGPESIDELRKVIDEELAVARHRVAAGTKPRDYYRTWVLEHGFHHL